MPRKNKPIVEIMPRVSQHDIQSMIAKSIEKYMDSLIKNGEAKGVYAFEPEPENRYNDIFDRRVNALLFEKYGCEVCGRKNISHASNGRCNRCADRRVTRIRQLRQDFEAEHPEIEIQKQIDRLTLRSRTARRLLGSGDE